MDNANAAEIITEEVQSWEVNRSFPKNFSKIAENYKNLENLYFKKDNQNEREALEM